MRGSDDLIHASRFRMVCSVKRNDASSNEVGGLRVSVIFSQDSACLANPCNKALPCAGQAARRPPFWRGRETAPYGIKKL